MQNGLQGHTLEVYNKDCKQTERDWKRWEAFERSKGWPIFRNAYKNHLERCYGLNELPELWHTEAEHGWYLFYYFLMSPEAKNVALRYDLNLNCLFHNMLWGPKLARRIKGGTGGKKAVYLKETPNTTPVFIDFSQDLNRINAEIGKLRERIYGNRKAKAIEDGIDLIDFSLYDMLKRGESRWTILKRIFPDINKLNPQKCDSKVCGNLEENNDEHCGKQNYCLVVERLLKSLKDRLDRVRKFIDLFQPD